MCPRQPSCCSEIWRISSPSLRPCASRILRRCESQSAQRPKRVMRRWRRNSKRESDKHSETVPAAPRSRQMRRSLPSLPRRCMQRELLRQMRRSLQSLPRRCMQRELLRRMRRSLPNSKRRCMQRRGSIVRMRRPASLTTRRWRRCRGGCRWQQRQRRPWRLRCKSTRQPSLLPSLRKWTPRARCERSAVSSSKRSKSRRGSCR